MSRPSPSRPSLLHRLRSTIVSRTTNTTRAQHRREIVALLTLETYLLSQCVLPFCMSLQPAQAGERVSAPAPSSPLRTAPVQSRTGKVKGKGHTGKATKAADAPPAWYSHARAHEVSPAHNLRVMQDSFRQGGGFRLVQLPSAKTGGTKTGTEKATIGKSNVTTTIGVSAQPPKAASGLRLLTESFPVPLKASAPLAGMPPITPLRLDLSNNRVPSEAEITDEGGLAGPLSPITPADAPQYAKEMDAQLKHEGFGKGLATQMLPSEKLVLDPGQYKAAKHLEEAKARVKKACDENRSFALSIQKWNDNHFQEAAQELELYAKAYPQSPWTPEALIQVANYAKFTGRGNEAEDGYRKVMAMTSNDPSEKSYSAHRKAFGRLTDLYLMERRYGEVKPMLQDFMYNDTNWRRRTWGHYWLAQIAALNGDKKRLLAERDCGTKALAALLAETNHPHQARAVMAMTAPRTQGFSLAELQGIAKKQGVLLTGFAGTTTQLQHVQLPVILHYSPGALLKRPNLSSKKKIKTSVFVTAAQRYGHFVIVRSYNAKCDQWTVLNPQDGWSAQLTSAQLAHQWSGKGLMLQDSSKPRTILASLPVTSPGFSAKSLVRLSMAQMRSTFGTGYAVQGQNQIGCHMLNQFLRGSCGVGCISKGEPSIAIDRVTQNTFITDTPVWYHPAKGPEVDITTAYNSQDASNYSELLGNKWVFSYGSFIAELPNVRTTVYMPDGAQVAYIPSVDNGNAATYISPRGEHSTLVKTAEKTFTLTLQDGEQRIFGIPSNLPTDTTPYLLEEKDSWGYSLHFYYNSINGKIVPTSITDADSKVTHLIYDTSGHLIYAQTPDEKQASFSYDANGNMVQCVDAAGQAFQYAYDSDANVVQVNTAQGSWTFERQSVQPYQSNPAQYVYFKTTVYDPTQSHPESFLFNGSHDQAYYEYNDHSGNKTTYTAGSLYNSSYEYTDLQATITSIQMPGSAVITYGFDEYSNSSSNSPNSMSNGYNSTLYSYNPQGRITKSVTSSNGTDDRTLDVYYADNGIDPVGIVRSGSDDGQNRLSEVVFQNEVWNNHHKIDSVVDANGHEIDYTYTPWGNISSITKHDGSTIHSLQYIYGNANGTNEENRCVAVLRDGVLLYNFTYDNSGRIKTQTDSRNLTTSFLYNNLDMPIETYFPDGTTQLTDYTCCSLPGMITDRSNQKTYYDYDQLKRLIRFQDMDGQTLQFTYDSDNNRTSMLDSNGMRTRWIFDALHRAVRKVYADGSHESQSFDNSGSVNSFTNESGLTVNCFYSKFGKLTQTSFQNSNPIVFGYDALDRKIRMTDDVGVTSWTYDNKDRVISEDGPFDNDTFSCSYNSLNQISGTSVQRNSSSSDTENFAYDDLGRLSYVSANAGGSSGFGNIGSFSYSYIGNTNLVSNVALPNGTSTVKQYDPQLSRLSFVQNLSSSSSNISSFGYQYGSASTGVPVDNRVEQVKKYGSDPNQLDSYSYNVTSMLTGEVETQADSNSTVSSRSSIFDAMGNRIQYSDNLAHTQTTSSYNSLNQLISQNYFDTSTSHLSLTGSSIFEYDNRGNMSKVTKNDSGGVFSSQSTYTYDNQSRLVKVQVPGNSKWEFMYDGMNRLRVSRQFSWANSSWNLVKEIHRVYRGMDVIQERDENNNVIASDVRSGKINGLLCRAKSGSQTFYCYDGSGNVTSLTDSTGSIVGSYNYDAWGNILSYSGNQAADNPFQFNNKEKLAGLYFFGYRFYSPTLGRWINRDPLRERGGSNLYMMSGNNLTNRVDLYGLLSMTTVTEPVNAPLLIDLSQDIGGPLGIGDTGVTIGQAGSVATGAAVGATTGAQVVGGASGGNMLPTSGLPGPNGGPIDIPQKSIHPDDPIFPPFAPGPGPNRFLCRLLCLMVYGGGIGAIMAMPDLSLQSILTGLGSMLTPAISWVELKWCLEECDRNPWYRPGSADFAGP